MSELEQLKKENAELKHNLLVTQLSEDSLLLAIKSMDPDHKVVGAIMAKHEKPICTRRWAQEWRPMWNLIIEELKSIDNELLKPLDNYIEEWIERRDYGVTSA